MHTHIIEMERPLADGKLRLWKYHLPENADRIQRLPISYNYDIEFVGADGHSSITPACWYMPTGDVRKLYWAIRNRNDFRTVYDFLKKTIRLESHQPIEDVLKHLSD